MSTEITIEKTDGSRRALDAENCGHAIPGEIGIAVVMDFKLFSFKRAYENGHKVKEASHGQDVTTRSEHQATPNNIRTTNDKIEERTVLAPGKKIGYGVAIIILDVVGVGITRPFLGSKDEPISWWVPILFARSVRGSCVCILSHCFWDCWRTLSRNISICAYKAVANRRSEEAPASPPTD